MATSQVRNHCTCTTTTSVTRLPHNTRTNSQLVCSISPAESPKFFSAASAAATNSTTTDTSSNSSSSSKDDKSKEQSKDDKSKKDDSNIFLDNLGKIFLSSIALVLVMLLRSTKSNNSKSALREDIESTALLDPLEIDDLRMANSDFTVEVWEKIVEEIKRDFSPSRDTVTYPEFLTVVVRVMREMKGEGFTVQIGHLVDRVVIAELERLGEEEEGGENALQRPLPLAFLLAALSLALSSNMDSEMDASSESTVSGEQVSQMVQHLQNTCQLVPEAQIVETNSKVPYQTYRVGTGDELTRRAREGHGGKKGSEGVTKEKEGPVTLEEFHAILKSRAVCAWGECYVKKTSRTATSDR
ncbi:hypothetical protein ACHAXR_005664 [Thalassiosira sp. AJA248-18]